ncbi:MAG: YraN family protein [Patescibacteria group bacterium]|nr:YraN family protein [Patescibacteria group bacterium]MDE2218500.1 YraN family protein [Patescibacteria group bacterium]
MINGHNQNIGKIGEETACKFLMKHGYHIVLKNYWKKWGEIDIITQKDRVIHFVEVKTVSKDLETDLNKGFVSCETIKCVNHETSDSYRPEDNIHPWKLKRLSRIIQTYLIENNISESDNWQFDVITVFLDVKNKKAKVCHIKDIIL